MSQALNEVASLPEFTVERLGDDVLGALCQTGTLSSFSVMTYEALFDTVAIGVLGSSFGCVSKDILRRGAEVYQRSIDKFLSTWLGAIVDLPASVCEATIKGNPVSPEPEWDRLAGQGDRSRSTDHQILQVNSQSDLTSAYSTLSAFILDRLRCAAAFVQIAASACLSGLRAEELFRKVGGGTSLWTKVMGDGALQGGMMSSVASTWFTPEPSQGIRLLFHILLPDSRLVEQPARHAPDDDVRHDRHEGSPPSSRAKGSGETPAGDAQPDEGASKTAGARGRTADRRAPTTPKGAPERSPVPRSRSPRATRTERSPPHDEDDDEDGFGLDFEEDQRRSVLLLNCGCNAERALSSQGLPLQATIHVTIGVARFGPLRDDLAKVRCQRLTCLKSGVRGDRREVGRDHVLEGAVSGLKRDQLLAQAFARSCSTGLVGLLTEKDIRILMASHERAYHRALGFGGFPRCLGLPHAISSLFSIDELTETATRLIALDMSTGASSPLAKATVFGATTSAPVGPHPRTLKLARNALRDAEGSLMIVTGMKPSQVTTEALEDLKTQTGIRKDEKELQATGQEANKTLARVAVLREAVAAHVQRITGEEAITAETMKNILTIRRSLRSFEKTRGRKRRESRSSSPESGML